MRGAGQVVVGQVEGAEAGHVGEGRGRDEGQLVGGHVEVDDVGELEAGQDGEGGVGQVQVLQTVLQSYNTNLLTYCSVAKEIIVVSQVITLKIIDNEDLG